MVGETNALKIYLAAEYGRRDELKEYRTELEAVGFEVVSSWLDCELPDGESVSRSDVAAEWALTDVRDLRKCDVFLLFLRSDESMRGGKYVELGIALDRNKICLLVGPRTNIFTFLPIQFESFPDMLPYLKKLKG